MRLHERASGAGRADRDLRFALRLYRRGRLRDLPPSGRGGAVRASPAGAPGRRADRARRARFAAARGRPLPLWPRTRRDGRPDRGGARLVDPEAPPLEGGFPGADAHPARADRRADAPARRPQAGRASAGARRRRDRRRRTARRSASSPPAASVPSVGAPIAMGFVQAAYAAVGTPVGLVVRGKPLGARVVALPFHPHAYYRG